MIFRAEDLIVKFSPYYVFFAVSCFLYSFVSR